MTKKKLALFASLFLASLLILALYLKREVVEIRLWATPTDSEFVGWEELKPGQKGFGLTVFKGTEPERFYVEFEEVMPHPLLYNEKVILVRMDYPLKGSRVVAGMSGSPVYFKHRGKWKLAGAIAFDFGLISTDKALGGITPIRAMLNQEKAVGLSLVPQETKERISWRDRLFKKLLLAENPDFNQGIKTLSAPIEVGAYRSQPVHLLGPQISIIKTSNSSSNRQKSRKAVARPKPGEAFSMVLVDGDYQVAATCTITYVKENQYWGCGHPVLFEGEAIVPSYKGVIATTFKSPLFAYKELKETADSFGYIDYDYLFAVRGKLEPPPQETMIRTRVEVTIGDFKKAALNLQLLKDRRYAQRFIGLLTWDFLETLWPGKNKKATVQLKTVVNFYDRQSIVFNESSILNKNSFVSWWNGFVDKEKIWPLGKAIEGLGKFLSSDWEFRIDSVNLTVHLEPGEKFLKLDSLALLDKDGNPTEEVGLGDRLKLVFGLRDSEPDKKFVAVLPVQFPKKLNLEKTSLPLRFVLATLYVESGNKFTEKDEGKLLDHEPDNADEFIQSLLINERDHGKIYVQLVLPTSKVTEAPNQWPKLEEEKWTRVKNLSFLRTAKPVEKKVLTQEIDSPLPNFLLDLSVAKLIKINLAELKPERPPEKKKSFGKKLFK